MDSQGKKELVNIVQKRLDEVVENIQVLQRVTAGPDGRFLALAVTETQSAQNWLRRYRDAIDV